MSTFTDLGLIPVQDALAAAVPAAPHDADAADAHEHAGSCCGGSTSSCCGGDHRDDGEHAAHGYMGNKEGYLRRLKRIEGQARGLHRMVEQEAYCIDILTQISAVTKALQSVALGLLEDHMTHCVLSAARSGGEEAEEKMQEASEAIARLVRS